MILAKQRVQIFTAGLVALLAIAALLPIGIASAGNSVGVPGNVNFEDGKAMAAGTGWNWTGEGDEIKVAVFLAAGLSDITEIEVFVGDGVRSGDAPDFSQRPTNATNFPTGTNIVFAAKIADLTAALVPGTTKVGLHLTKSDDTDSVRSKGPANTSLVDLTEQTHVQGATTTSVIAKPANTPVPTPTAVPTATPAPTATAVPTATPAPTATAVPPKTGDTAPSSLLVLSLMLGGLLLMGVAGVYIVGGRKVRR